MQDLTLAIRIRADGTAEVVRGVGQVETSLRTLGPAAARAQGDLDRFSTTTTGLNQAASGLRTVLLGLGAAIGGISLVNTLTAFESLRGRLESVTGSALMGEEAFRRMQEIAKTTPATLKEVTDAFAVLSARGMNASDEVLRQFANLAAGSQKTLDEVVQAVLDATQGEFERLKEFGIQASKSGDQISISFGKFARTVKNDAAEIEQAFVDLARVNFGDATAQQMERLPGLFSNLTDTVEQFLVAIGDAGLTDLLAAGLKNIMTGLEAVKPAVVEFTRTLISLGPEIKTIAAAIAGMMMASTVASAIGALSTAFAGATITLTGLNAVAAAAFGPAGWIALGVGLLIGLVTQMDTTASKINQLRQSLTEAYQTEDRATILKADIALRQEQINALNQKLKETKELIDRLALPGGKVAKTIIDQPELTQARKDYDLFARQYAAQQSLLAQDRIELAGLTDAARQAAAAQQQLTEETRQRLQAQQDELKGNKALKGSLEDLKIPYAKLIEQYAQLYGVAPKVVAAMMSAESAFQAQARSPKNAQGLMQLLPGTFQSMLGQRATDIYNVNQNIEAGTKYLAIQLEEFKRLDMALVAYNAGPGRARAATQQAARLGTDPLLEFTRMFPAAAKETIPYIEKILATLTQFGEGKYEIDQLVQSQNAATEAARRHAAGEGAIAAALGRVDEAFVVLQQKQDAYVQGLNNQAQAAQDALLQARDPEAYRQVLLDRELAANRAAAAELHLSEAAEQQAEATIRAKDAAQEELQTLTQRQNWAQSILQGFDQLWSNMISGADNAMAALRNTLKSWLYAIGQWLLKQTLIIPMTAGLFGVSQQSLGGGLLGSVTGGGNILSGLSNIGSWFGGHSIAGSFQDMFQGAGQMIGAEFLSTVTVNAPNWMFGAAGALGGLAGQQLFGGYGGIGGALGGMAGTAIGSTIGALGWAGGPIGGLAGSLLGGAIGGLFGGDEDEVTGGAAFYSTAEGAARGVHSGTAPATVAAVAEWGKMAEEVKKSLEASGIKDFFADLLIDADSTGRVAAQLVVAHHVMRQTFGSLEEATTWAKQFMAPMVLLVETMTGLGQQATMTAAQLFDASNAIMALAGGADAYAQKSQALLAIIQQSSAFQEKQLAEAQSAIDAYEAQYGAILDSADAVYAYMQGLELTTASGQQAYAALLDLTDALALVQSQTDDTTSAIEDQIKSVQAMIDELRFGALAPGSPMAALSGLQAEIDLLRGQYAQAPSEDLLAQLEALMRQQLNLAASYYGITSPEYATIFNGIMLALQELNNILASMPQYATGTPYVPQTQMAIVHQGEQIIPAHGSSVAPLVLHFNINGSATQSDVQYAIRQSLPYLKRALVRT